MDSIKSSQQYLADAESGDIKAQLELAIMYSNGYAGLEKDYVLSHKWAVLAAINGNAEAGMLAELITHYMSRQELDKSRQLIKNGSAEKIPHLCSKVR